MNKRILESYYSNMIYALGVPMSLFIVNAIFDYI